MLVRLALAAGLLMVACASAFGAEQLSVVSLIQQLQRQGYVIVYSDRLVTASMQSETEVASLVALQQSLARYGLLLQQQGEVWIITRLPALPQSGPTPEPRVEQRLAIENVIVTGSVHSFPEASLAGSAQRMLPDEMSQSPALGSDVMRAMVRLPGISSVGVSAKPRIRGGLQDELLVLQDGVELLEPFHLADYHSAYSAIDYHTIESVDFYTGGFPSRYGNRISGVMDISNEWSSEKYRNQLGISSFSSFFNTRGAAGEGDAVAWLLSYRQGDLEDLTDYIETRSGEPTYQDISARLNIKLNEKNRFSSGLAISRDDIVFNDQEEGASSQIDSYYLWSRLEMQLSPSLKTELAFSYVGFERQKNEFSAESAEPDEVDPDPSKGGFLDYHQQVERFALRNDFTIIRGSQMWELGWQAEYARSDYRHRSEIDRGELSAILATERLLSRDIQLDPKGYSGGGYVAAEFSVVEGLLVQPSLRWDVQDYYDDGRESQWSPRLGLAYEFGQNSRVHFTAGRFYQPEGVHELQLLDGELAFFKPQHADQLVLGLQWGDDPLQLSAEVYYKRYRDLKVRYENVFNPFVLLPEMEPDRVRLKPERAYAAGFDLGIKYQFNRRLRGDLRYSAMQAEDRINGQWVARRWSQQETVNALLVWEKNHFSASIAVVWHSGWRTSKMPATVLAENPLPLESVLNNSELGDYFSLDLNVRKTWSFKHSQFQLYADVTNATNRNNIAGVDYDIETLEGDEGEPLAYQLTADRETLLSIVPSIGFIWSF
jgi:outer membrane receptor protein involved in Fe transport